MWHSPEKYITTESKTICKTVHRVFRNTSTWEYLYQALEKNRKLWIDNQYPKNWSDRVVFETLNKIIEGKKNLEVKASEPRNDKWSDRVVLTG